MFTGIVSEVGLIRTLQREPDAARLSVQAPRVAPHLATGDSVAVNGCCLTVVEHDADGFTADVMGETLRRTALAQVGPGTRVNLEPALAADGRLGGHLVQGHIDGTGTVSHREHADRWDVLRITLPDDLARYVAMKGSITVDGVSLTVSGLSDSGGEADAAFEVSLIPTTLEHTTLGERAVGDLVNLEVDVLAKYVERLLEAAPARQADPA